MTAHAGWNALITGSDWKKDSERKGLFPGLSGAG